MRRVTDGRARYMQHTHVGDTHTHTHTVSLKYTWSILPSYTSSNLNLPRLITTPKPLTLTPAPQSVSVPRISPQNHSHPPLCPCPFPFPTKHPLPPTPNPDPNRNSPIPNPQSQLREHIRHPGSPAAQTPPPHTIGYRLFRTLFPFRISLFPQCGLPAEWQSRAGPAVGRSVGGSGVSTGVGVGWKRGKLRWWCR